MKLVEAMVMAERAVRCVLVAADLSETSPALIAVGADAARQSGGDMAVLYVFDPEEYERILGETGMSLDRYLGYLRTELYDQVQAAGVEVPVRLEIAQSRSIAREIVATAVRLHAALIVIGTRRRHGIGRAWIGGVAGEVLRLARTPVLVAPASLLEVTPRAAAAA